MGEQDRSKTPSPPFRYRFLVGTGVFRTKNGRAGKENPCPWEPATRVHRGQARTGVSRLGSALTGEGLRLSPYVGLSPSPKNLYLKEGFYAPPSRPVVR